MRSWPHFSVGLRMAVRGLAAIASRIYEVIVFDDTVSGAPETALIEPPLCRLPPPAPYRSPTAPCGLARPLWGSRPCSRRFCAHCLPPHASRTIYITPSTLPRKATHFLFLFLQLPASRPVHCPLSRMPRYPNTAPFWYGTVRLFSF